MRQRKSENRHGNNTESNPSTKREGSKNETNGSWWGLLKYSLLLLVPGFLNHAALYREDVALRPQGELYDIGWKQKLFMACLGHGPPTVILDAPTGKSSDVWALVAPQIAKVAKVCFYDRAGLGFSQRPLVNWSDPEQAKRGKLSTSERMVEDFQRLFTESSDQPKPFILVGAELGAVNARFYTQMFENNVASLILINPLVEGMFGDDWTRLWFEQYVLSQQVLQFSAATGITRLALILGLMKVPLQHKLLPANVTMRQKYLLCKPGHLSSGVDEFFFANESLAQMRMLRKIKPFPQSVDVSIISSAVYDDKLEGNLQKVWSRAQDQISNVLHPGSEKIPLSGNVQLALLQHSEVIVKVITKHVTKWRQKQHKPKSS